MGKTTSKLLTVPKLRRRNCQFKQGMKKLFSWKIEFANVYEDYNPWNREGLLNLFKTGSIVLHLIQGEDDWKKFQDTCVNANHDGNRVRNETEGRFNSIIAKASGK